jgi:hypothetical protein
VTQQPGALQVIAVGVFASSVPLAIYAATAGATLRELGATAPGATIALTGGILAAETLGLTGLVGWVPLAWAGLAIAALAELATLVLMWPILGVVLPLARVLALAWLLVAGARLSAAQ